MYLEVGSKPCSKALLHGTNMTGLMSKNSKCRLFNPIDVVTTFILGVGMRRS